MELSQDAHSSFNSEESTPTEKMWKKQESNMTLENTESFCIIKKKYSTIFMKSDKKSKAKQTSKLVLRKECRKNQSV